MARRRPPRARRPPRPRLEALGDEAKSVLAVLALASAWPARFLEGWTTTDELGRYGTYLGDRPERESLKAAIRRALRQIESLALRPRIESRRTKNSSPEGVARRELDRRLGSPVPTELDLWLLGEGLRYLTPGIATEFIQTEFRPATSFQEVLAGLEETVVRTLLGQGRYAEALTRVELALRQAGPAREHRALAVARATILLRRSRPTDWQEAHAILRGLIERPVPVMDHADRLTEARLRLTLAYSQFLLFIRGKAPATPELEALVASTRALQREASALASELSLSDRGQIADLEGLLLKWEAQVAEDDAERRDRFDQAERSLRQALTFWKLAHDSASLGVALYNLGELRFARAGLYQGAGSETEIREALTWYRASVGFTESLGTLQEWILDYGKVAECVALLIPHLVSTGRLAECETEAADARYCLTRARSIAERGSWQSRFLDRVEGMLFLSWTRHAPPLPAELPLSHKETPP